MKSSAPVSMRWALPAQSITAGAARSRASAKPTKLRLRFALGAKREIMLVLLGGQEVVVKSKSEWLYPVSSGNPPVVEGFHSDQRCYETCQSHRWRTNQANP